MEITGKTVVVAGGAGSIGSAIVEDLQRRGARVVIIDKREMTATEGPQDTFAVQADAADEQAVESALETIVGRFGNISALVNCAGMIHSEPLINVLAKGRQRHQMSTWDAVVSSNLTATFVLTAQVAEQMAKSRTKGVIVNFSSIAAKGNPGQTAYAAAKAGIEAMTRGWARELGPMGIRVLAIAPGFVDTPSTHAALPEALLTDLKRRTPLRRLASIDEIAAAVGFALTNDFLTGQVIAVDGGLVL
jgi:3-oxoacyl-[acyl-carrier protein] reductase